MPAFMSSKKAQLTLYAAFCVGIWLVGFWTGNSHAAQIAVVKYPKDYVREASLGEACVSWDELRAPWHPTVTLYTPSFQGALWDELARAAGTDIEESVLAYGRIVLGTKPLVSEEMAAYASNIAFICKEGGTAITDQPEDTADEDAAAEPHPDHTEDAEASDETN